MEPIFFLFFYLYKYSYTFYLISFIMFVGFTSELDVRSSLSYRRNGNPPPTLFNTNQAAMSMMSSATLPRNYHSSEFSSDDTSTSEHGDSRRHSDEEEQVKNHFLLSCYLLASTSALRIYASNGGIYTSNNETCLFLSDLLLHAVAKLYRGRQVSDHDTGPEL
jgi:hypothetical protein